MNNDIRAIIESLDDNAFSGKLPGHDDIAQKINRALSLIEESENDPNASAGSYNRNLGHVIALHGTLDQFKKWVALDGDVNATCSRNFSGRDASGVTIEMLALFRCNSHSWAAGETGLEIAGYLRSLDNYTQENAKDSYGCNAQNYLTHGRQIKSRDLVSHKENFLTCLRTHLGLGAGLHLS